MARTPVLQEPLPEILKTVPIAPIFGETFIDWTLHTGRGPGVKVALGLLPTVKLMDIVDGFCQLLSPCPATSILATCVPFVAPVEFHVALTDTAPSS